MADKNDERGGAGRLVTLSEPGIPMSDIVERVKHHLGMKGQGNNQLRESSHKLIQRCFFIVQVATPYEGVRSVKTIAICAGSGGSMLQGVDADLYFTGEMQHVSISKSVFRRALTGSHVPA